MKQNLCLVLILILTGCATQPSFDFRPSEVENIGLLMLLDDDLTHIHVGTTVFNNSTKKRRTETIVPSQILVRHTTEQLEDKGYKATIVKLPEDFEYSGERFVTMGWNNLFIRERYRQVIENLVKDNELDLLIYFYSFSSQDYIGHTSARIEGHGLYTRSFMGNSFARVYANVRGYGINGNPVAYIDSSGTPTPLPIDIQELTSETAPEIEREVVAHLKGVVDDVIASLKL